MPPRAFSRRVRDFLRELAAVARRGSERRCGVRRGGRRDGTAIKNSRFNLTLDERATSNATWKRVVRRAPDWRNSRLEWRDVVGEKRNVDGGGASVVVGRQERRKAPT